MGKGSILMRLGRYEDALLAFDNALKSDYPDKDDEGRSRPTLIGSEAWLGRGEVLVKLGRYDEALRAYDGAINSSSSYLAHTQKSEAWTGKGKALQAQNRTEEALEAYNKAIDLSPINVDAWKGRGEAQTAMGIAADTTSSIRLGQNILQRPP